MSIKNPDTKYDLEKYLKKRKNDSDKPPCAPSGFMKKQIEQKRTDE